MSDALSRGETRDHVVGRDLPLYCGDCNEVHHFTWPEVERIVYALQGDLIDETTSPTDIGRFEDMLPDCLWGVLRGSNDGEVYKEWTDSAVESRTVMEPVPCPLHDAAGEFETGPHHHPLCHYFDPDEAWPEGVDRPPKDRRAGS